MYNKPAISAPVQVHIFIMAAIARVEVNYYTTVRTVRIYRTFYCCLVETITPDYVEFDSNIDRTITVYGFVLVSGNVKFDGPEANGIILRAVRIAMEIKSYSTSNYYN